MNAQTVLELLVRNEVVDQAAADGVMEEINQTGSDIIETLVNFEVFEDGEGVWKYLAEDLQAEYIDLKDYLPPTELLHTIPAGLARLYGALPVNFDTSGLTVVLADPFNPQSAEDLRFALGKDIIVGVADGRRVEELIASNYGGGEDDMGEVLAGLAKAGISHEEKIDFQALEAEANSAPIIRYVDLVLFQAIKEKASDIHFEPFANEFKIRYRVDGALYEMAPPPAHLIQSITSRIKVMSNLNIAERRVPQDGRIVKTVDDRQVDMRVSTLPTQHGESIVLRVLDRSSVNLDLENLGMSEFLYNYIGDAVTKPNGIFICTGPTGAGKTTTLYAALRRINAIDTKLLTAEDPVEYDIDGIIQVPVNETIGLTFQRVLRAFLRQDPDKIMVGEMRDLETAQIAIQAALTGHLVLSTLHTNDSSGAVTRLLDMGCESFLLAATLDAVLAQRLLRSICNECRTEYTPDDSVLGQLGLSRADIGERTFFMGAGCEACTQIGYKGRMGLYELLDMSDPLRELVIERAPTLTLKEKAIELGMETLRQDGFRNIYEGKTTIEEVLKYT